MKTQLSFAYFYIFLLITRWALLSLILRLPELLSSLFININIDYRALSDVVHKRDVTRGHFYHGGLCRVDNRHPVCPLLRHGRCQPSLGITALLSSDRIFIFFMEGLRIALRLALFLSTRRDDSRTAALHREMQLLQSARRPTKPILTLGSLNRGEGT